MNKFLIFVAGAAAGAVASFFVTKKKLNSEHEEEINSLREMYDERVDKIQHSADAIKALKEKKDAIMHDMEQKAKEAEKVMSPAPAPTTTIDYSAISARKKPEAEKVEDPIRIVTEQEAQKYSKDYELIGLSLYEDNVLIDDETENIIEDFGPWVGVSSLSELRNSGDESVYILNEGRKAIYDITVLDERFGDVDEPFTIE